MLLGQSAQYYQGVMDLATRNFGRAKSADARERCQSLYHRAKAARDAVLGISPPTTREYKAARDAANLDWYMASLASPTGRTSSPYTPPFQEFPKEKPSMKATYTPPPKAEGTVTLTMSEADAELLRIICNHTGTIGAALEEGPARYQFVGRPVRGLLHTVYEALSRSRSAIAPIA